MKSGNKIWLKSCLVILGAVFSLVLFPKLASAATLYLSPGSGNYTVGSTFNVTVGTNTQGAAVNTAEVNISYSTNTLELVSVKQGSTFYLASPGSPRKASGTAYFAGGLPTPGYSGSGGTLGIMTFRTIAEGTGTISVTSGKVLLNDGLGTDALSGTSGTRVTIAPPPVGGVAVSSTTHPNQDSWYAKSTVDLSWNRPNGAYGYSFEFDQSPNTTPDTTLDTTVTTTKSYTDLKDGIWYFHIRARPQSPTAGFGATTHYKIQIDTVAPAQFTPTLTDLTISFEATDVGSGIDHYEISVDAKVVEPNATSPYTLSNVKSGDHKATVKAYDKAGNSVEEYVPISIKGIGFFNRTLQVPLYLILALALLILILLLLVIWLMLRKKGSARRGSSEIEKLQEEVDRLKREYSQAQNIRKEIDKTKRNIESKLNKIKKGR